MALDHQAMLQVLSLNGLIPGDLEETTWHVHTEGDHQAEHIMAVVSSHTDR